MIRDVIKAIIKPLFRYLGLEVTSFADKPEPAPVYTDLDKVLSLNRTGAEASYECPLEHCLILNGFSFSSTGWHPFVESYRDIYSGSDDSKFEGSFLEKYYQTWAPSSSADAIAGFSDAPLALKSIAAFTLHAPWMEACPKDRQTLMERIIPFENAAAGCPGLPSTEGYGLHGPVSEIKGEVEFRRLVNIHHSIKRNGYDRTKGDGDVTAIGIEYYGDYRFCIMHGQHRVAAATALGFKTVPVNITKLVHYSEIAHWPQVYRGVWSEQQAQKYIEHLFTFNSKAWAEQRGLSN